MERKQRTLASTRERVVATVLLAVVGDTRRSCGDDELEDRGGGRGRGWRISPSGCTGSRIGEYQGLWEDLRRPGDDERWQTLQANRCCSR